ncbi:penicillin-binding protein 1 [Gracilibacillus halophilus YIM-C55.5]|uniref:Penicillin-binding protein 1 n=1 Tax=Gracilibacillus halophilus YIM-C55.5 TaxID=1308866 RepID=N4W8R1_9BACI|nr:transglycosylase domain-containing protein [Gracilibacillus halophilus]ENH95584.1 penicillin-binding protein 1 [Gracilibacillus halophilus YIM-C55.5]
MEKLQRITTAIWKVMKQYRWLTIAVTAMFLLAVFGYLFIIFGGRFIFDEEAVILPTRSTIVTDDGTEIGKIYSENRAYVDIEDIPDHVQSAFLAVEDQRFFDHAGISFPAVARAVFRDVIAMEKAEGGSTITQQLAKNLFLSNDKTWMRKTKEVMASLYLERNYSKEKILELYVNEIYFAHGIYGVGTAADYYFDKEVSALTIEEAAMLAGLVKAPNTYSPYQNVEQAKQRRNVVLELMQDYGTISTEQMIEYQQKTIDTAPQHDTQPKWADDYIDYVVEEIKTNYNISIEGLKRGGYTIEVHLDPEAQKIAYQKFQQDEYFPGSTNEVDGAWVLMEKQTGHLTGLLAGRAFSSNQTNHPMTKKQPGSLMKPIAVYGPAMDQEDVRPYDLIPDELRSYGDYRPRNANDQYAGEVSVYEALVHSKNAPAVWLLHEIGMSTSQSYLEKMNLHIQDQGLAVALGGLTHGLTPIDITESYRTFASQGNWIEASSVAAIFDHDGNRLHTPDRQETNVFSAQVAWNLLRMLEGVVDEGTAQAGQYEKALAGKTGSTEHPQVDGMVKDAWFSGFTPEYVTTTWIGVEHANKDHYLTEGSAVATKLTKAILSDMDAQQPLQKHFERPHHVDELPEPIDLPVIDDLTADVSFGGFTVLRGELTWTASSDDRIEYRIYEKKEGSDEQIGSVTGDGSFTVKLFDAFRSASYYVVPYDPLTKQEGKSSNVAKLSFDF